MSVSIKTNISEQEPIICIVGPTATGKSNLAVSLATQLDGEVVSADSMQIYRGMDIGTNKLPVSERKVPHWGLDLVDPGTPYSAALFQRYARTCFEDIAQRGKRIVLCGGSGFYVRAALDNYNFPPGEQQNNRLRDDLHAFAAEQGPHALWELLAARDSESAALIAERDVKRVIRAFELLRAGTSYAEQKRQLATIEQKYPAVFIGLSVTRSRLNARIDKRVDSMVERGLVKEVENLLQRGFRNGLTAPQAIGYKEIVSVLDGEVSLSEALENIKRATRRYAKRQRTWFRKDERIQWIEADITSLDELLQKSLFLIEARQVGG